MTTTGHRSSLRTALCYLLFPLLGFVAGWDCDEDSPAPADGGDVVTGVVWVKGSGGSGVLYGMDMTGDLEMTQQGPVFPSSGDVLRGQPYVAPEASTRAYLLWTEPTGATSVVHMYEEDANQNGRDFVIVDDGGFVTSAAITADNSSVVYASNVTGDLEIYRTHAPDPLRLTNRVGNDSAPDVTADGAWVVYSAYVGSSGLIEIMLIPGTGGDPVNLTNNAANDANPRFSADGTKIVFSSNRNGNYDIFMMNTDGTGLEQLTSAPNDESVPALSTDMQHLVYVFRNGTDLEVYALELGTGTITNISRDPDTDDFSPHCGVFRLGA